jgi:hypothetical protein
MVAATAEPEGLRCGIHSLAETKADGQIRESTPLFLLEPHGHPAYRFRKL